MSSNDDKPILFPLKRMLYSRKVLLATGGVFIAILGEYGLSMEIVKIVEQLIIAVVIGWTAEDAASKFRG